MNQNLLEKFRQGSKVHMYLYTEPAVCVRLYLNLIGQGPRAKNTSFCPIIHCTLLDVDKLIYEMFSLRDMSG